MSDSENNSSQQGHKIHFKKMWLLVAILAFFLALIFIGYLVFFQNKNLNNTAGGDSSNTKTTKADQTVSEAQKLVDKVEKDAVIKSYDSQLAATSDSNQKIQILLSKAAIYFNDQDFKMALEATQQASVINETIGVDDFIGQIYVKLNDNSSAVKYYQKCLSLLDKESLTYTSDISYYNNLIKQLKAEG